MTVCLDEDQEAGVAGGGKKRLPSLQIRIHHVCLTMPEAVGETKLLAATTQCLVTCAAKRVSSISGPRSAASSQARWLGRCPIGSPNAFLSPALALDSA